MNEEIVAALTRRLSEGAVLVGADVTARYHVDFSHENACAPLAVLRPSSTEEVALILEGVPSGAAAGGRTGRPHGPRGRRHAAERRDRDLARAAHAASRRSTGVADDDRARGHAAASRAAGGRGRRLPVPARSRRARLVHDRRQHRDQRGRQPGDPLRHDAQPRARARGRARRRHRRELDEQDAEEQHGLRPEAAVHRLGRHARDRDARGAAPVPEAAEQGRPRSARSSISTRASRCCIGCKRELGGS